MLLGLNKLALSFADRTLFSGAELEVGEGDKIGFVGVNGCGKTSFLRLLKGELSPDEGTISFSAGCRVGFMEQFACEGSKNSLQDEALTVFSELSDMELELLELHDRIDRGDCSKSVIERQAYLSEEYERRGGLTYKSRTAAALLGLGFAKEDFHTAVSALSGGQRSKLQLAKLLLSDADLLLLDEPTNHLDIESTEWLEDFLTNYKGAYIVVSHDRYFLDKVTNRTIELENSRLTARKGNFTRFLELKAQDEERRRKEYDAAVKEIGRIEGVIAQQKRWNQAHNYVTIASKQKSIERIEKTLDKPEDAPGAIKFSFKAADGCGNDVLTAKGLSLGFGEKQLFRGVNLDIKKGERVFLIGSNGCGKTSLFRILTGQYAADRGEFSFGARVDVGYFDQAQQGLTLSKSAIDEVWDEYPKMTETEVRTALAAFLFKGDDVYKKISELSGGERARVALLKLMLSGANLLLLDEPTNHLDITSREALENALLHYDGTLFVISHDRYLINKLADRIYKLSENGVREYLGNYDYYLEKRDVFEKKADVAEEKPQKSDSANDYKQRKARESELRKLKTAFSRAEQEIERLDGEIAAKTEELTGISDYKKAMELSTELDALHAEQEQAFERWEQLGKELEAADREDD